MDAAMTEAAAPAAHAAIETARSGLIVIKDSNATICDPPKRDSFTLPRSSDPSN